MGEISARLGQDPAVVVGVGLLLLVVFITAAWLLGRGRKRPGLLEEDLDLQAPPPAQKVPVSLEPAEQQPPSLREPAAEQPFERERVGLFERVARGLSRTRAAITDQLDAVFGREDIDQALFEQLEEVLILADVGVKTSSRIVDALKEQVRKRKITEPGEIRGLLREQVLEILGQFDTAMAQSPDEGPLVVLVVGVNGGGKTTTIGKLAARYGWMGRRVILGAGDTFRAGAVEQLRIWAERTGADIVSHDEGADPSAVLFDTLKAARARGHDVVICDTAGRLQSRRPLMDQLGKVTRVLGKAVPGAPHEVLLVLDATIGQNALSQARIFGEVVGVTGLVLTKLDGTAKGGVVVAVCAETGLPVKFIGIGEKVDDLRPFDGTQFVDALLAESAPQAVDGEPGQVA